MNFVYDPKIAAEIDGYVNYICAVVGRGQGAAEDRSRRGENPLIFPTPAMLKQLHQFDPKALFNPDYKRSGRSCSAPEPRAAACTWLRAPPAPRLTPYLLWRRGSRSSRSSSWSRSASSATSRSRPRTRSTSRNAFNWAWHNYSDALTTYHTQLVRSFEYAAIATAIALLLSYPLAYWIAFRGGRWKNLFLLMIIARSSSPT